MAEKLEELEYLSQQLHAHNEHMTRAARSNSIHIVQNQNADETEEVMKLAEEVRQLRSMSCMVPTDEFDEPSFFQEYLATADHKDPAARSAHAPDPAETQPPEYFARDKLSLETDQQTITPPENQDAPPVPALRGPDTHKTVPAPRAKKTLKKLVPATDPRPADPLATLPQTGPAFESPKGAKQAPPAQPPAEKLSTAKSVGAKGSPDAASASKQAGSLKQSKPQAACAKPEPKPKPLPAGPEAEKPVPSTPKTKPKRSHQRMMDEEDLRIHGKAEKILRYWANRELGTPAVYRIVWKPRDPADPAHVEITDLSGKELMKQQDSQILLAGAAQPLDADSDTAEARPARKKNSLKDADFLGKRAAKKAPKPKPGARKSPARAASPQSKPKKKLPAS